MNCSVNFGFLRLGEVMVYFPSLSGPSFGLGWSDVSLSDCGRDCEG